MDVGFTKVNATGEVFNLVEAKELNGNYIAGAAGATFIKEPRIEAQKSGYHTDPVLTAAT